MATSLSTYALLLVAILTNMAGHILFKYGAMAGASTAGSTVMTAYISPFTLGGFATYGFSAIAYIAALKQMPLSVAMPSMVAGYIGTTVFAHLVWGEPLGIRQVTAFAAIGIGLYLLHTY